MWHEWSIFDHWELVQVACRFVSTSQTLACNFIKSDSCGSLASPACLVHLLVLHACCLNLKMKSKTEQDRVRQPDDLRKYMISRSELLMHLLYNLNISVGNNEDNKAHEKLTNSWHPTYTSSHQNLCWWIKLLQDLNLHFLNTCQIRS